MATATKQTGTIPFIACQHQVSPVKLARAVEQQGIRPVLQINEQRLYAVDAVAPLAERLMKEGKR